jgi:peptide/nickel transport system permease protein
MTVVDQAATGPREAGPLAVLWRGLRRSPSALAGAVVLLFWILCAFFGHLVVPHDPLAVDPIYAFAPPSADHWFGTDSLGRDVFSRVIVGAREIFLVAPVATILGVAIGTFLGLAVGYFRGPLDAVVGRLIDAVISLPTVVVALVALAALGPSKVTIVMVVAFVFTPYVTRTVRTAVLHERELEYIEAARIRGENAFYIMTVEILPNVSSLVVVEATVRLGYAIFAVTTLSFIGFGIQPPSPDWGLAIFENYGFLAAGLWWPTLFPALAIASLVVSVNLLADGIAESFQE